MAKKPTITLDDFVKTIKKREARAGFSHIMKDQKRSPKTADEWEKLYLLFMTRPIDTPWETWIKKGGK